MRAAAVFGIVGAVLGLVAGSPGADEHCGCGVLVAPPDSSIAASNERAIVHWSGDRETMQIMLDVRSTSHSAGIIIPTPSAAEVSAGDPRLFGLIDEVVKPVTHIETDIWGLGYFHPEPPPVAVTVLDRVRVGDLETVVLAASDGPGLSTWLAANGFESSKDLTKQLQHYVDLGWTFAVVKLAADADLNGRLDPIELTFDTKRLVYPMTLGKFSTTAKELRLYVLDDQRTAVVRANSPTVDLEGRVSTVWAGEVTDRRLTALGSYLTVFDIRFDHPDDQISGDIGIVHSQRENDVKPEQTRYRMVTLLGLPVGSLVVVWALLGVILAVAHANGRRRAR